MEVESCVPPGFRFHPTEEELVGYYLTRKISSQRIELQVITDIDLYKIEPWELQDRCKLGYEEQNEWYFFSHKDKKYPSGTRTNRATTAGFWKATGRDKAIVSKSKVIGMRKTLVYYQGRAPNGRKTDWIMHEYRLQMSELGPPQEEGWVVCRAFKKPSSNTRQCFSTYNPGYFQRSHDHYEIDQMVTDHIRSGSFTNESMHVCGSLGNESNENNTVFDIPAELHSPGLSSSLVTKYSFETAINENDEQKGQLIDWKVLDQLLASQLCESALSSNLNPLMAAIDHYDKKDQYPVDHYLASFPNS